MKTPDKYTTETHMRPHSQLAKYLARPKLPKSAPHRASKHPNMRHK